jgi:glyoxylase-like metal-dependent hydrolase (beta-lactamase superfamily II)
MQVADGVERFEDQGVVNWYLVETDQGPVAVDAGFPTAWDQIERRAHELRAIVLTHAHVDHLGFAERARSEAGVPVYVPQGDAELARHTIKAAKSERNPLLYTLRYGATRRLYLKALRSGAVRAKALRDFKTFGPGQELPAGLRSVSTPGHTFGHAALHLPERDVLFAGDAIVTRDPYTDREGPCLVARAATADSEQALRSLDALAATGARIVLTGHGEPWTDGAEAAAARARELGAA